MKMKLKIKKLKNFPGFREKPERKKTGHQSDFSMYETSKNLNHKMLGKGRIFQRFFFSLFCIKIMLSTKCCFSLEGCLDGK